MRIGIVGAGPAGCHLAHRLRDLDHDVLLFDPRAPYEKPCGGGLGPLIGRHIPDVMDLPFPRHHPSRLVLRGSDESQMEQTHAQPPWAIVSREALGQGLLQRALLSGHVRLVRKRVVNLERWDQGWRIKAAAGEVFSVDYLVGADGVRSIVRRRVVGRIPRQHLALAMGYFVKEAPDAIVFQTFTDLEGYLWSFPRVDHASVGIGCRLGTLPAHEIWQRLDRFLDKACPGAGRDHRWAALLPMAASPELWDTPCAGPAWALLGDAAGHVHPIIGEGIAYALWSAELLAQAFADRDPLAFEALWRARYGQGLARASEMLRLSTVSKVGGYEILFHLVLMAAIQGVEP